MIEITEYKIAFDKLWAKHQELQAENKRSRALLSKCATVIKSLGCEPSIEVKDALGGDK